MLTEPRFIDVPVSRIFLFLQNPRHEPVKTESEAIEYLCAKEDIYALARDISKVGLSPLERFAIIPAKGKSGKDQAYIVPEGNRRICAVKLLNDPDLAPVNLRKAFESLAHNWTPVEIVHGALFDTYEQVRPWMDRTHSGAQAGIGRRQWKSEQKARFDGTNKNKPAQAFLDYAEAREMITPDQRRGKLTTVQRFIGNGVFREALGLDVSNQNDFARTRPREDFDILAKQFVADLIVGQKVTSRMNKPKIESYGRTLGATEGLTGKRIEPESLNAEPEPEGEKKPKLPKPKKPEKLRYVANDDAIARALTALGNEKLSSLYYSICSVDLEQNTPLIAIGVWSFLETLTACMGRNDRVTIDGFLPKSKLTSMNVPGDKNALQQALERVREFGNTTKHHPISAFFNGNQLNNDVRTLRDVILTCIEEAAKSES